MKKIVILLKIHKTPLILEIDITSMNKNIEKDLSYRKKTPPSTSKEKVMGTKERKAWMRTANIGWNFSGAGSSGS